MKTLSTHALKVAILLFLIYVGNVLVGKISLWMGEPLPIGLDSVAEFLLLFASSIFFVIGILVREALRQEQAKPTDSQP